MNAIASDRDIDPALREAFEGRPTVLESMCRIASWATLFMAGGLLIALKFADSYGILSSGRYFLGVLASFGLIGLGLWGHHLAHKSETF